MRILHLSDVHFGRTTVGDQNLVLLAIQEAVRGVAYDVLILSGDIANSGQPDQYDLATTFIKTVAVSRPALVVPGNHDVDRGKADAKALLSAYPMQEVYNANRSDVLRPDRFEHFLHFSKAFNFDWNDGITSSAITLQGIHFIGVNTALLSHRDQEETKLCVDVEHLQSRLAQIPTDTPVVAIGHHPLEFLTPWNGDIVRRSLSKAFHGAQVYLYGHKHDDTGSSTFSVSGSGIVTFQAGASYQGSKFKNSFRILELDPTASAIISEFYEYNDESGTFDQNKTLSHPVPVLWPKSTSTPKDEKNSTRVTTLKVDIPSDQPGVFVNQLEDLFSHVWEPETLGSSWKRIFWPVRLRRPTLIHASRAFVAAAFLKRGVAVTLCLDDFGNTTIPSETFLDRIAKHFAFLGAPYKDLDILSARDVLTDERLAKSWSILSEWLTENGAKLQRVLRICKLLVDDNLQESLSKKPRRILTPAVIWSCLNYVIDKYGQDGKISGLLTLGGYDERDFWHVWNDVFAKGHKVGHLYGPELATITTKTSTNRLLAMAEHDSDKDLYWASKDDIENSLSSDAGSPDDPKRILGWLLAQCLVLPNWLLTKDVTICKIPLRTLKDLSNLAGTARGQVVEESARLSAEILLK